MIFSTSSKEPFPALMASGLAAFGKYLPPDLVKLLVSEGVEARPGGAVKEMTVLFADIAGFTGLSERLDGLPA
jgi:adenylate cyclase